MSSWNQQRPNEQDVPRSLFDDIERIKGLVARYFPIYNIEVHFDTVSMKCNVQEEKLEENFDELRLEMKELSYVPLITKERGEYIIHVVKKPPSKFRGIWLNIILLIATIGSTTLAGAGLWSAAITGTDILAGENLLNGGLYFALPLMLILSIHEMAHYLAAKKHNVAASLPFFIPLPISVLGTLGALISIREPIPTKKALLDIGFAGPIAGFVVTIPVLIIGLGLTGTVPQIPPTEAIAGGSVEWGSSLFFEGIVMAFGLPSPLTIHPTAFAGWVGLFVTALNLLPAGQLDGGHIARALMGDRSKYAGYGVIALMLGLGLFYDFTGWLFLALLIMFMGIRHPPPLNDVSKLDTKRKLVGVAAAVLLVLCFVPVPMAQVDYNYDFAFQEADGSPVGAHLSHSIDKAQLNGWQNSSFPFRIVNNGNMELDLGFRVRVSSNNSEAQCWAWLSHNGDNSSHSDQFFNTTLEMGQVQNLTLNMMFSPVTNATQFIIEVEETEYPWTDDNLNSASAGEPHGMRVAVKFS